MLFFPGVDSYLPNNCWHKTLQLLASFVSLPPSLCLVSLLKVDGEQDIPGSFKAISALRGKGRI